MPAVAARLLRGSKSRHAADILSDRDGSRPDRVDNFIGQPQINQSIIVHLIIEIIIIGCKGLAQTVVQIKHTGDTIETKPVQLIFIQPEATVGQQKMQHLVFAVIKTARVPQLVVPPRSLMKILIRGAVKATEAFHFV